MLLDGLTVFENICLPQVIAGKPVGKMEEKARKFCKAFGIEKIQEKYPAEISGGEKQRTAVARAMMNSPYILLADEPTGNLDSKNSQEIMQLLRYSNEKYNQTMLVITHDENIALQADRILSLEDGRIVKDEVIRR